MLVVWNRLKKAWATIAEPPPPATTAPPAVATLGSRGSVQNYALEDHTHADNSVVTSTGAASAAKLVKTDGSGRLDKTVLPYTIDETIYTTSSTLYTSNSSRSNTGTRLWSTMIAGKDFLAALNKAPSSGGQAVPYLFEPSGITHAVGTFQPYGNGSSFAAYGLFGLLTATATATRTTNPAVSLLTSQRRLGLVTTAGSGNFSHLSQTATAANVVYRSSSTDRGGFFFYARFGIPTSFAGMRYFIGLINSANFTADPSGTGILGFGCGTADTSLYFYPGGTNARVPLTGTAGAKTVNYIFDVAMWSPSGSASIWYAWRQLALDGNPPNAWSSTSQAAAGGLATNLVVRPYVMVSNGTTAGVAGIDLINMYMETEL